MRRPYYINEIDRQKILEAVVIDAPGIARYVQMIYSCVPWLIAGIHLIRPLQETQQSDALCMFLFSLVI